MDQSKPTPHVVALMMIAQVLMDPQRFLTRIHGLRPSAELPLQSTVVRESLSLIVDVPSSSSRYKRIKAQLARLAMVSEN